MEFFRRLFRGNDDDAEQVQTPASPSASPQSVVTKELSQEKVETTPLPPIDSEKDLPDRAEEIYDNVPPSPGGQAAKIDELPDEEKAGEKSSQATGKLNPDLVMMQTKPLDEPTEFKLSGHQIQYGVASHVGRVRSNNQDATLAVMTKILSVTNLPSIGLFAVADGMGGHHDGELASALTVQTLASVVLTDVVQPQLVNSEKTSEQKTIPEVLHEAMNTANSKVKSQVPDGGTTATCAVIRGDLAYISHVGDSRAYLINDDTMELVTRDHSLVQRLIELGQLTEEEAEVHPQRNVLYRAIGQGDGIEPDTSMRRLPPKSRLLLCSDGLWSVIGDEKIKEILGEYTDPQEICDKLVEAANVSGGPDNISVLLIQMPE